MEFKKELLHDLVWDDSDALETVLDEIVDTSRWSVHHKLVFAFGGKFFRTHYSVGATEQQDERPFEYDPDMIECEEVFPHERTIIVYEPIPT